MILSDKDIKRELKSKKELDIIGVKDLYIGSSSVDLHLSGMAKVLHTSGGIMDCKTDNTERFETIPFKDIVIQPGVLYILSTKEKIKLGKSIAAFIQGRSSLARLGISVHAAGFADSGFEGTITLEVTNMSIVPIRIYEGMRICQIVFIRTETPSEVGYGEKKGAKYQNQTEPGISKINEELK